ncbi:MAG: hypothetical protein K8Q99_06515 [Acholeplasmataceae bacterium]|nr:hypothetical protein [Acholeplasmataceae bacterium]
MKQRKLVIGLLVMLAVAVSGFTFAFWAGSLSGDDVVASNSVTIGTGEAVTTEVTFGASQGAGTLVPSGRADDSVAGAVESVVFSFVVTWAEAANGSYNGNVGTLASVVSNVQINGATTNAGLVNPVVGGDTTVVLNGATATVTVTVTLTEPATQEIYNAIVGQAITFDVTFTVTPAA